MSLLQHAHVMNAIGPTDDERRVGGIGTGVVDVLPGRGGSGGVSPVDVDVEVDEGGGRSVEVLEAP